MGCHHTSLCTPLHDLKAIVCQKMKNKTLCKLHVCFLMWFLTVSFCCFVILNEEYTIHMNDVNEIWRFLYILERGGLVGKNFFSDFLAEETWKVQSFLSREGFFNFLNSSDFFNSLNLLEWWAWKGYMCKSLSFATKTVSHPLVFVYTWICKQQSSGSKHRLWCQYRTFNR